MNASIPPWIAKQQVKVYPPSCTVEKTAWRAAEMAWLGQGVCVFRWPCGRVILARIGTPLESRLLAECPGRLLGAWSRGSRYREVLAELRGASA